MLFLGLYLLLLAFFIMLDRISSYETRRSGAVLGSLNDTFPTIATGTTETSPLGRTLEAVVAARAYLREVGTLVAGAMALVKVEIVRPGEVMRATVPLDALFEPESASLRAPTGDLFDRIAGALAGAPDGNQAELELVIGTDWLTADALSGTPPLPLARAAALGRALRAHGVRADRLAAGLVTGDTANATFFVRLRPDDAGRLDFRADDG